MEENPISSHPMDGPQNLNDLQNYLVTFNKEIGVTGENTFQQNISQMVEAQQTPVQVFETENSVQVRENELLSKLKGDKQSDEEQILPAHIAGGITLSEVKSVAEVVEKETDVSLEGIETDEQLNAVHAQIAGLASGQLQAVSISGHISLESLQGLQSSHSDGVMMIPINADSMVAQPSQQLFQIVPIDSAGQPTLQLTKATDGSQETANQIEHATIDTIQATENNMIDGTDPVAVLASVAANTSTISQLQDLHSAQLVALQNSSDSSQPQLVAVQSMDDSLGEGGLQVVSAGDSALPTSLMLNTGTGLTLMPSGEMNQHGDVNYVLIVNPHQSANKTSSGPVYDFGDDIKGEVVEEITDEDGSTKRIVKINQLLAKKSLDNIAAIPYGDQLMCSYCNYTSPKRYLLSRHMKSHSDDRPHKCNLCERGFKTMASLQNHVNTHSGIRPHKCKLCEAAFTTSGELVRHIRYKHTFEKPHKCTECDYASVELSKLKRHMRSHTGERPYQCMQCNYASPDTYKLKRHLRIHTGEKPYECNICHARFTQSNSLKAHKLIHTGNKPVFQCDLCPATCGRKTDLKIHMQKLHTSEKPLVCKKCGSTFPDRYTFKMHTKTHDGEKCYKCPDCDYAALSARHLETHALTHTGEKPFECEECDQSFRQKQLLKRHKNLYHTPDYHPPNPKDKEHECSECEKAYAHKGNLLRHMQQHDDGDPEKIVCTHQKSHLVALTADQVISNSLLADMKEGKLGASPKVVVVHPDGRVEEVTAKLQSLSQSKPVDDFLMSLGVTGDTNFDATIAAGVDESGDAHVDPTSVVLTMSADSVPVSATFQAVLDGSPTAYEIQKEVSSIVEAEELEDDQTKDAGTQAAFDSDSDEDQRKKGLPVSTQDQPLNCADVLPSVLEDARHEPADMEDVQHIMISVLAAEESHSVGLKRPSEEDHLPAKKSRIEDNDQ